MTPTEYSSHPIREMLDRLNMVVYSTELTDPDLLATDAAAGALQLVGTITGLTRTLLQRTPPQFVSGHGLAQLMGGFQNTYNELTAYQSDRNVGHLPNARAQIEQNVMPFLWAFAPVPTNDDGISIVDMVAGISKASSEAIDQVRGRRDEYLKSLVELRQQIATGQEQAAANAQLLSQQRAEVSAAVAVIQKENAERELRQSTAFEEMVKAFKEQSDETIQNSETAQSNIMASLKKSESDAAQIVQVVGNIGVTGNFKKIANTEGTEANRWRWITIAFFSLGIAFAIATFLKFWDQPLNPENALSAGVRLLYAIVLTTPAWYAARESARHRTNADRARQTELELASLGPFIELMPDETKQKIRQDLITKYFGNQVSEHGVSPPFSIKEIGDFAANLIKAAKK